MSRRRSSISEAPLLAWGESLRGQIRNRQRRARCLAILAAGIVAVVAPAILLPVPRLVWNASASAPVGLYRVLPHDPVRPGDMIVAKVPDAWWHLAAVRHYLPLDVPLVKRVAAVAGDDICASGQRITINGRWRADRLTVDGKGRFMPAWHGCVRLRGHEIFLLMDHPSSFDGRYFGITRGPEILGRARLLWAR